MTAMEPAFEAGTYSIRLANGAWNLVTIQGNTLKFFDYGGPLLGTLRVASSRLDTSRDDETEHVLQGNVLLIRAQDGSIERHELILEHEA
ncbi:hypothetical protein [Cupriavidus sp. H18C1]|uniref:hypothetical protein n=1 Tax=Cupriavidus sp. H18C1 TaxID=3241601 RepID=UPI003BB85B19